MLAIQEGDFVECIDNSPHDFVHCVLECHGLYRVRQVFLEINPPSLRLYKIKLPRNLENQEHTWGISRFRLVYRPSTSRFIQMLNTNVKMVK